MRISLLVLCISLFASMARAEEGDTRFAVSGPSLIWNDQAFWGANLSAYRQIGPRLEAGLETGYFVKSTNANSFAFRVSAIPLVPTILFSPDSEVSSFAPFMGLGAGVVVLRTNAEVKVFDLDVARTYLKFQGLIHLGAKFGARKNLFLDFKAGLIDNDFAFSPTIGWFF